MNQFEKAQFDLEMAVKKMLKDGFYPRSILWMMAKMSVFFQYAKEHKINIVLTNQKEESHLRKKSAIAQTLYKLGFKNYRLLKLLNKIISLPRWIFLPKWIYLMDGHKFLINERDVESREITKDYTLKKIWEPETTKIVKDHVKEGMTCVDIGASVGYFTMLFSRQVGPKGKVVAIEPTKRCFRYLLKNIQRNGYNDRTSLNRLAAWDKDEKILIPVNDSRPKLEQGKPVDDLLESFGIRNIDFLKIDVDGPEPRVLKGLKRTIERSKNLKMVIEYYPKYLEMAGESPKEFMELIDKYFTYERVPGDYNDDCYNLFCIRKSEVFD